MSRALIVQLSRLAPDGGGGVPQVPMSDAQNAPEIAAINGSRIATVRHMSLSRGRAAPGGLDAPDCPLWRCYATRRSSGAEPQALVMRPDVRSANHSSRGPVALRQVREAGRAVPGARALRVR